MSIFKRRSYKIVLIKKKMCKERQIFSLHLSVEVVMRIASEITVKTLEKVKYVYNEKIVSHKETVEAQKD